jgi:HK97 gp10 family phage protein
MNARITVEGLPDARRTFARVVPVSRREVGELIRASAEVAARVARAYAPRRTGRLASAIGVTGSGMFWRAGVDSSVDYGHFLEYGTSRMSARPFMRPGAEAAEVEVARGTGRLADRLPHAIGK